MQTTVALHHLCTILYGYCAKISCSHSKLKLIAILNLSSTDGLDEAWKLCPSNANNLFALGVTLLAILYYCDLALHHLSSKDPLLGSSYSLKNTVSPLQSCK